jgi:hypothetical protein
MMHPHDEELRELIERHRRGDISTVQYAKAKARLAVRMAAEPTPQPDPDLSGEAPAQADDPPQPQGWTLQPPPENLEDCVNVDELDRCWAIVSRPHLVNSRYDGIPRPRNAAGVLLVIFLGVSAGGLFAAASSGWFAVLAVIVAIILLIGPVLKEMAKDTDDHKAYKALYESYHRRRADILKSDPAEARWVEARLDDLDQLNHRDDLERWWRHAQKRCGVSEKSGPPTGVRLVVAITLLLAFASVGLPGVLAAWKDPNINPTAWWLAHLLEAFLLGYAIWGVRSVLREAAAYREAQAGYEGRLVVLGEEPKW